ncbi:CDP-archaeol synthase [Leucobacter coleopterorum]|uniref:CDP-archaeol synthase n=1 Tax=Leucobacter coleopterorum TaxID=2714933 RepID=A0ABX6JYH0_9MICO|nr:CDP-archaeol synthase [Leucobacter coleopterorum]QIM17835.1 CDP-archaeol synthase [Leucobacter coleopterorum]
MIFTQSLTILSTILIPGLLFILMLKRGWLPALRTPIDRGTLLGGKAVFGPTKTWLGVVVYTLGAGIVGALWGILFAAGWSGWSGGLAPVFESPLAVLNGATIGLWYAAAELLNSFVKRRLGIAPSAETIGAGRILQRAIDLGDGILAVAILLLIWRVDPVLIALTAVLGFAVHALTDVLMYRLRLKHR